MFFEIIRKVNEEDEFAARFEVAPFQNSNCATRCRLIRRQQDWFISNRHGLAA
jgi:hypothetical protein